jgi:ribosomal protein L40E
MLPKEQGHHQVSRMVHIAICLKCDAAFSGPTPIPDHISCRLCGWAFTRISFAIPRIALEYEAQGQGGVAL